jgi:hypothetical protein
VIAANNAARNLITSIGAVAIIDPLEIKSRLMKELELEPALKDVLLEALEMLSEEIDAFTIDPHLGVSAQQLLAEIINWQVNNGLGGRISGGDLQEYFDACVEANLPDGHE